MLTSVDSNDQRAVRNKDNVVAFYDLMLNQHSEALRATQNAN